MKKILSVSAIFLLWGCASAPFEQAAGAASASCPCNPPQQGASCACSAPEPSVAYAVTTPGSCNDFPVAYRVRNPKDNEGRVLPVDQPVVRSAVGTARPVGCCR